MEEYINVIKKCPLFAGINESELRALLNRLSATEKHYHKNKYIFTAGDTVTVIGIVLSGNVHIIQDDFWGNRTILSRVGVGGLFGEAFTCAGIEDLPVSVLAAQTSDILLIDYRQIITTSTSTFPFHTKLIENMLRILASKNVTLTQKMGLLTQRTTREKLLSYLSAQAQKAGSHSFEIPFNRQELAEYLSVDRSALSNELSKMRNDKILTFHRNQFELLRLS